MQNTNQNNKLFIFGIICLVISLGLLFFSLYILPYLIWEFNYDVPDFIITLISNYQDNYYSLTASKTIVWLYFFIPAVFFGFVSYFVSNYIDKHTPELQNPEEEEQKQESNLNRESLKESASLGGKLIAIIILIFVVVLIMQEFISITS